MTTSTDLDLAQPPSRGVEPAPFSTGGNLIREAAAVMADAHLLAKAICGTQMVPQHFRGKPDETAAAMLYGASLGLDPMQAVKGIYVVHGSAALYARTMSSIVMRDGHDVWTVSSTDDAVTVRGRRRGWPEDRVEESTWDMARATKAGYTSNAKYKSDPQAMLYAKALSEVCRKIAPDSLAGVYTVEEMQLEHASGQAPAKGKVTAATLTSLTRPAAKVDEATGEVPDGAPATPAARAAMFSAFDQVLGGDARTREGKKDRLDYLSAVLGRTVESTADLTAADVDKVTEQLRADLDAAQETATVPDPEPADLWDAEDAEAGGA